MKKLKIVAHKLINLGFWKFHRRKTIATIYIKNGKVVVESKLYSILELRDEIQKTGESGGFHYFLPKPPYHEYILQKIGDEKFLEGVRGAPWWTERDFGGWTILLRACKVVE